MINYNQKKPQNTAEWLQKGRSWFSSAGPGFPALSPLLCLVQKLPIVLIIPELAFIMRLLLLVLLSFVPVCIDWALIDYLYAFLFLQALAFIVEFVSLSYADMFLLGCHDDKLVKRFELQWFKNSKTLCVFPLNVSVT